jgi:hypothetical protein
MVTGPVEHNAPTLWRRICANSSDPPRPQAVLAPVLVCDHDDVDLRVVRPRGTFRARLTRDGEARRRDGQTYVLENDLGEDDEGGRLVEIMFKDGVWMLTTTADLDRL